LVVRVKEAMLHLSNNLKEKKRNINIDLAILLSHGIIQVNKKNLIEFLLDLVYYLYMNANPNVLCFLMSHFSLIHPLIRKIKEK